MSASNDVIPTSGSVDLDVTVITKDGDANPQILRLTVTVNTKSYKPRSRAKVAPVNLIYGSHFFRTEATYKVSQNMGNFVEFTRITHQPVPV